MARHFDTYMPNKHSTSDVLCSTHFCNRDMYIHTGYHTYIQTDITWQHLVAFRSPRCKLQCSHRARAGKEEEDTHGNPDSRGGVTNVRGSSTIGFAATKCLFFCRASIARRRFEHSVPWANSCKFECKPFRFVFAFVSRNGCPPPQPSITRENVKTETHFFP